MYRFKRLMVALDFTLMDKELIQYTAFISKLINPEKIYFLNVQHDLDIPDSVKNNFPELQRPLDEKLQQEMREEVKKIFPDHQRHNIEYEVIEGSPFEEMLKWTHIKNIDLLIMGRKEELKGSGVVAHRLARKVMCSVLFITETAKCRLKQFWVPTDFSENAQMALEEAVSLAKNDPEARVHCHHVYHLPSGYYTTGKSEEEFSEIMKEHAEDKYNEMISKMQTGNANITISYDLDTHISPANLINDKAHAQNADLIVVGAKGRTAATAVLLGSITEKLIKLDTDIPVLVVKQKDKSFNFMEFIKNV